MKTRRTGLRWPMKAPPEGDPEGGSPPAEAPTLETVGGDMSDHVDSGNPDRVGAGADEDEGQGGGESTESGESGEGADTATAAAGADDLGGGEEKPKRVPWHQTRINQLTKKASEEAAEKTRLAEENARLRTLLGGQQTDAGGTETGAAARPAVDPAPAHPVTTDGKRLYTEEEVAQLAGQRARVETLNRKIDEIHDAAVAADPQFVQNVAVVRQAFGDELAQRPNFFEALTELDNGAQVMATLWGDPDRLAEMLTFNPTKLGLEMAKLSGEVKAKAAPKISKAPAPIVPLGGGGNLSESDLPYDSPQLSMNAYSKRRAKERQARAEGRS